MIRYADDLLAFAAGPARAEYLHQICRDILTALQLRIHPVKTSIRNATKPFVFLGKWLRVTPRLLYYPAMTTQE